MTTPPAPPITTPSDAARLRFAREALCGLVDAREFLGYQLSHATGGMLDEELDEMAEGYLRQVSLSDEELAMRLVHLQALLGERFDTDVASVAFKVDIEAVTRVLRAMQEGRLSRSTTPGGR